MRKKILLITQVYSPDPAAVGRLMADVADELARRGESVVVVTANRGYDNPAIKYQSLTTEAGVEIRRVGFSSFGKKRMAFRILAGLSFTFQAILKGLTIPAIDCIVVSTVPPMGALAAVVLGILRGARIVYWPMDLNPDQVLALKLASPDSTSVRLMEWLNGIILRRSHAVVTLDQFMGARLDAKESVRHKLTIVPPWPDQDDYEAIDPDTNPFRQEHGLVGKRVIMYSGTLGPSNPVDTLLRAAEHFEQDENLVFLFVGGGSGMRMIKDRARRNVRTLPYVPLDRLRYSIAASDVQIVSLGESMVGIVHPCKVYGAMANARPILSLGPALSHVSDLVGESDCGWRIAHGDLDGAIKAIEEIRAAAPDDMRARGSRARQLIMRDRSKARSCGQVCDVIQRQAAAKMG